MSVIKVDYGEIGGGALNPTYVKGLYLAGNSSTTETIDVTKTYIVFFTVWGSDYGRYVECALIEKGEKSELHQSVNTTISVSGTTLSIANGSSLNGSGAIVQLD